jgi:hypothetical protein
MKRVYQTRFACTLTLDFLVCILAFTLGLLGGFVIFSGMSYNDGQKDALRGQQKYKMEIHYRYEVQSTHIEPNNDSSTILYQLVPFDTTFVKK